MFQRILVPLDGSPRAELALPVAARLARASGGMVMLTQIVQALAEFEVGAIAPTTWAPAARPMERKDASVYLHKVAASESLEGVTTETGVYAGPVAAMLLLAARTRGADLIVMTTRGLSGFTRWALGSVAEKVAQLSPVPVLLLREPGGMPLISAERMGLLTALVALDGSGFSEASLVPASEIVRALAAPSPGALHLVRVLDTVDAATLGADGGGQYLSAEETQEWALQQAKAYLEETAERLRERLGADAPHMTWSVVVNPQVGTYEADVASAILRTAEEGEPVEGATAPTRCSLVVMATHGRTGLSHMLLGSITQRVLRTTTLPLLVVRPHTAEIKPETQSDQAISAGGGQ
ncbi:MAG TPA: universal stress protein [Ktedonobacterales bacterium]|nr:universal stress protein [Ktedonobacterales bacterium]